eukprot:TRINITY_DN6503_c0_g1_i13.p1 TRINITY_DN6503_c0_g1~~TRINITY_DN6503_c0_g1_i13.p1  ORF type:complete len:148 (+),score=17.35 TRINITY_DN6503_c0_g1_i13:3-446(+)
MFFFLMIRRPPRSTQSRSSAASDVYKRQVKIHIFNHHHMFIGFTSHDKQFVIKSITSNLCNPRRRQNQIAQSIQKRSLSPYQPLLYIYTYIYIYTQHILMLVNTKLSFAHTWISLSPLVLSGFILIFIKSMHLELIALFRSHPSINS